MRRLLVLVLLAGCAVAQETASPARGASVQLPPVPQASANVTERLIPVSHADLYCSGFLGKAPARTDTFVLGGLNSPNQTRFHQRDFVFINGDYPIGSRISFVRQTKDIDRTQAFKGQSAALKKTGDVFNDLGYAVVVEKRGESTVAEVEFACDAIVPGDFVVPFVARPEVSYRERTTIDRFPEKPHTDGRIIAARDFDQFVASGQKVYLDIGSQKGVKPGDLFLVVRSYRRDEMDATDQYEAKTGWYEETRKNTPKMPASVESKMPERVVGEAVVLSANEQSATAMLTFALSEVHVGDRIASETAKVAQDYAPATEAKSHSSGKSPLSKLCVFAILGCDKDSWQPHDKQASEDNAAAGASAQGK